MGVEIERKFLVDLDAWNALEKPTGEYFRQGYILTDPHKTIRIRQTSTTGYLTIKGKSEGATRLEYEYTIPLSEAQELLDHFAEAELAKTRYKITVGQHLWEVDVFEGDNQGLIVAEIELTSENESFEKPHWVTEEVTGLTQYYNSNLTKVPFSKW